MNRLLGAWSLRTRLVVLTALMLVAVAVFLWIYFPARMEHFSRRWVERRAIGMALVTASAAAPGLEFDDTTNLNELLAGLSTAPEATYAAVRRGNGTVMAAWKPDLVPAASVTLGDAPVVSYVGGQLRVDAPIKAKGGSHGSVTLGFSLDELEKEVHSNSMAVALVSLLVFLFGLAVSFVIGTVLVRPVQKMTAVALRIADGDISQREVEVPGTDEIGRMASAFNRMLHSLRVLADAADHIGQGDLTRRVDLEGQVAAAFNRMIDGQRKLVGQIADTSIKLGSAAAQIYAAAQEQEAAASKQAAGVEEVNRTMQSLLESASNVAESARGVFENAQRTRQTSDTTVEQVNGLSGHAGRIAELLEVIRDIADRSDLLALNASLEATRAGDAGRAFSLVASEMRRLAERVTTSVSDVKSLLVDIRSSGASAIVATEEGRKLAEGTTESARQITMVTQQQRTVTGQILESMREISTILSQTASSTQDTRASIEMLRTMAESLTVVVGQFRINAGAAAATATAAAA